MSYFRKTTKWVTKILLCSAKPGWNFLSCEDDIIEMRQNLLRLNLKDPDMTLSRGRRVLTRAHTYRGIADCCWVTGAQQTHTDREIECEGAEVCQGTSSQRGWYQSSFSKLYGCFKISLLVIIWDRHSHLSQSLQLSWLFSCFMLFYHPEVNYILWIFLECLGHIWEFFSNSIPSLLCVPIRQDLISYNTVTQNTVLADRIHRTLALLLQFSGFSPWHGFLIILSFW